MLKKRKFRIYRETVYGITCYVGYECTKYFWVTWETYVGLGITLELCKERIKLHAKPQKIFVEEMVL